VARVRREVLHDTGVEPTAEELAEKAGVPVERLTELEGYTREPVSLHAELTDDGDTRFADLIVDSDAPSPWELVTFGLLREALQNLLADMPRREAEIITLRYGLFGGRAQTLEEIGKAYGVSRERIRQIEAKTMSKLRHPSRARALRGYLDRT
jgi:RNA polymerase primary sigma factor